MAEKKRNLKDYESMSRKDLTGIVKDLHKMSHDERMEHTSAALTGYQSSGVIDSEYNKTSAALEFGKGAEKMQGLYKKLHGEHAKKKGDLEQTVTTGWLKDFAEQIMPVMHVGAKGHPEENYQGLVRYLREFDRFHDGQTNVLAEVRGMIKKGRGHAAAARIIEAVTFVTKHQELNNFVEMLLPNDHYDFIDHASKRIAKDVNKTLKGKSYEVSAAKVSGNFITMYQHYSHNDYKTIAGSCQVKKKTS